MATIYARLIQRGFKTIDDVPKNLRKAVEEELKKWQE